MPLSMTSSLNGLSVVVLQQPYNYDKSSQEQVKIYTISNQRAALCVS